MKLSDQIRFTIRNMRKNKLRIFMTVLATTMGSAFLIVLASVGFGLQNSLIEEASSHQPLTQIQLWEKHEDGVHQEIDEQMIEEIKAMEHIKTVVPRSTVFQMDVYPSISLGDYQSGGDVIVTDFEAEEESNLSLSDGRFPESENEILAGYHFSDSLISPETAEEQAEQDDPYVYEAEGDYTGSVLGQEVTISFVDWESGDIVEEETFTIAGITEAPARDWSRDGNLYVAGEFREQFMGLTGQDLMYTDINAHVTSVEHVENVTNDLKEQGYSVYSISEELSSMNMFFNALKAGLIFVGTIAVLIASIGIFNTMTMAVTERTHEIGVMKALGADPSSIRRMFLMESSAIGFMGALFGVMIAYIVSIGANLIIPSILASTTGSETETFNITFSAITPELVLTATAISVSVAMISGYRPALRATKVNVLSALRREA
ncbi:macrolide ABC transporter permease [Alteribacter lacisalsi]|uniref:Macrolide ABC transporter permease n=1 Tax=Alteribacter lacisalsi TaxID=2045244 RepID=A0A2W0HWU4_9BACI|nr:FtsX-like permease family protein [Alteribacter lacisalsi]PYZ98198.1 macrolide ABC transporter permease [Alteribacter lacisalsi]